MRKITLILVFLIILISTTSAQITTQEEGSTDTTLSITLVDIYTGDDKQSSGCIFDVNGQTAVVGYHDTEVVNGVSIYVQEVYAVNTQAQDKDNCAFLYYLVNQPEVEEEEGDLEIDESMDVQTAQVGEEEVNFVLTSREEYDALASEQEESDDEYIYIEEDEEIPEQTAVKISGVDVTGTDLPDEEPAGDDETNQDDTDSPEDQENEEEIQEKESSQTFFAWMWNIIFG